MAPTVYAERARLAKVIRLLALLPPASTREHIEAQAAELESWDEGRRLIFARVAGVNRPSDETWRVFVEAARARCAAADVFARIERSA